jgi:hypothetical protein
VILRRLIPLLPAAVVLLSGIVLHAAMLVKAGIWAAAIISISTLLTTAALRNHPSFRMAVGVSAAAMAIRLGGLVLLCISCAGRADAMTTELVVAGCLFLNVIIEGFLSARVGERSSHAR